jgi:hypothetical protein
MHVVGHAFSVHDHLPSKQTHVLHPSEDGAAPPSAHSFPGVTGGGSVVRTEPPQAAAATAANVEKRKDHREERTM